MERRSRPIAPPPYRLALTLLFGLSLILALAAHAGAGPLSERVFFVARVSGFKKIYLSRPDGRDLRRLTPDLGHQTDPTFSQALERVFYVRLYKGRHQICSVNLEGENFRVEVELHAEALFPDVSQDGHRLVFVTDMWGAFELAEMDLVSREITRLTYDQTVNLYPKYSPSGHDILFTSLRTGHSELFLLKRETGGFQQLTDTPFSKGAGEWSPDGRRVVSTERIPPRLWSTLFELDLESGKTRRLLPATQHVALPSYSPDGTQILFLQQETLFTHDPSDTVAVPFPVRGNLQPSEASWSRVPLP